MYMNVVLQPMGCLDGVRKCVFFDRRFVTLTAERIKSNVWGKSPLLFDN